MRKFSATRFLINAQNTLLQNYTGNAHRTPGSLITIILSWSEQETVDNRLVQSGSEHWL